MGLEQYLYKVKGTATIEGYKNKAKEISRKYIHWTDEWNDAISELNESVDKQDIGYWRKEYDLDNYITDLYYEKGGQAEEFNCEYVELNEEDIEYIVEHFNDDEDIVEIFTQALEYIEDGYKIWYSNWY